VKFKYVIPVILLAALVLMMACGKPKVQPTIIAPPPPPPVVVADTTTPPPPPPPQVAPLSLTTIYFDYDKSDIRSDARNILAENAKGLTDHPTATIRIEGNCDERGTDEYNLALGQKRADAARDYLVNYGISASRLSTISYGESRPVSKGHDESSWSQNRRDEFSILAQ
jgi:peptidoglycan-associated lipoprotein